MFKNFDDNLHVVSHTLKAWSLGDIDEALRYMAPDIEYFVNVDPRVAPFAASTSGVAALRERMQLLLDTFRIEAFVVRDIRICEDDSSVVRVNIEYVYRERTTNTCLDGHFRLIIHTAGGMISQIEKIHDSHYVEAFARLVDMMHETTKDPA
ncbi:MAG TPA: nuclear transport factor 2 family protein [Hyphomicrobiaceae bacterium]|nr:nuclear transport factor 2 family protein [Hyphomicrobiaceae bacterium]